MEKYQKWMHFLAIVALALFIGALLVQVGFMFKNNRKLKAQLDEISSRKEKIIQENSSYTEQLEYLSNPSNLEKELKARFNYKKYGEEMMIVVPQ